MRTIVDIPEGDLEILSDLSQKMKVSRAEVIRRALRDFIAATRKSSGVDVFGIWRDKKEDSLSYEDSLRSEWNHDS